MGGRGNAEAAILSSEGGGGRENELTRIGIAGI